MAAIVFCGLNISAIPHPEGIYRELFSRVAGKRISYYGDKIAAISRPSEARNGVFWGYVHTWTEIDRDQKFIDTILLQEPKEEDLKKINIPENIGFNSQVHYYVFNLSNHTLVIEIKNADGASLSPSSCENIFRRLFDQDSLHALKFELTRPHYVEVDLVIEAAAVDKILGIEHINMLEIMIRVPNADDETTAADELLSHLQEVKARSQQTIYKAADRDEGIKADARIKAETSAALRNGKHGYVKAEGKESGEKVMRSSKEYPKRMTANVDFFSTSTLDAAIEIARKFLG